MSIRYRFTGGKDQGGFVNFTVSQFNNPVVEHMPGFKVESLDDEEYKIAETDARQHMSGIVEPASFRSVDFNYVDLPHSGQLAKHQFILQSGIPIQYGCRVRIVYPVDMKIGSALTLLEGTGFFAPAGGTLQFTANATNNSVDLVACKKNYGQHTAGILTLTRVLNQPFKHDLETFKIYMAVEIDSNFDNVYQRITSGFAIKAAQQKAGLMTGRIEAKSNLVQTFTPFSIWLKPSMDLEATSHIIIKVPKTLEFQGPSCTVAEHKGFSDRISCSRVGHLVNISNPFDSKFVAKTASTLFLKVEEFLMPTSVQDIGNIELTFWDIKESQFREVDVIDFNKMKSRSGEIQKVSEVEVGTDTTSLTD